MENLRLEKGFFGFLLALVLFLSFFVLSPYVGVLVFAATLAILFRPWYNLLLRFFRYKSLAAFMSIVTAILIVFVPLGFFMMRIFSEATSLYVSLSSNGGFDFGSVITHFLQMNFPGMPTPNIVLNFNAAAREILNWFIQNLGSLFSSIAQILFAAFLSLLGLFYFLQDGSSLRNWTLEFVPLAAEYTNQIIQETEVVMSSVVRGTLIVAIIQGIIVGTGFFIFGIPNAAFWGALTVLASLIPIVGTWLVVVPAIGYLFLIGDTTLSIGLLIWSVILVNIIYNVVSPQLMHRGSNIHPFMILLSVLGGIAVFGPIGFLVGPFIIALLFSLLHVYPKLILGGMKVKKRTVAVDRSRS